MDAREPDLAAYPPGTLVDCLVTRVEPFGVFVRLAEGGGVAGFIQRHDWSWSRRVFDLEQSVHPGERLRARVLRHHKGELQLSRRDATPDPYPAFRREHAVGDLVVGEVKLLSPKGAGVLLSLAPGVDGFVPRSEIPDAGLDEDGFGLVTQDRVAVSILRFSEDGVVVSLKEQLRRRDAADADRRRDQRATLRYHPTLGVELESLHWQLQLQELAAPEVPPAVRERIRRVLVVEDSDNVSASLEMVLRHFGFCCVAVGSVEEARQQLAGEGFDLIVLDLNLPVEKGVALVRELQDAAALVHVFVLTAATAEEWARLLAEDAGARISVFQKPTRVRRLFQRLERQVTSGGEVADDRRQLAGFVGVLDAAVVADDSPASFAGRVFAAGRQDALGAVVEQLRQETGASQAVLLSLRPGPIFERVAGTFAELTREVQQSLEVSPIGNVIREGGFLAVPDTAQRPAQFRHLLEVAPLRAFAGVALDYQDQARYGLFLFGEQPHQLQGAGEGRLLTAAQTLGRHLAEARFDGVLAENQGLLLTGFLADSLLHEIKNELQALEDYSAVQLLVGQRSTGDLGTLGREELKEFLRATVGIQDVSRRLNELVVLFRNLAGRSPVERVDLNQTVRRLQQTLQPFAEDHGATVVLELAGELPEILVNPRLVDQPILNLMINGIEQMALRACSPRRLRIATSWHPEADYPLAVTVSDTGRGIHFVDRERIFDLFFTTKPAGTGLGLYVSRFFVQRFGGRLVLRDSLMFAGSEFAVEIPRRVLA